MLLLLALASGSVAAAPIGQPFRTLTGRYVSVDIAPAECVVTNYGAKGDGKTDDTKAIQAALDHCGASGGGTVVIPAPKTYLIFSIHFTSSNQELRIEQGATLLGSNDIAAWDGSAKTTFFVRLKQPNFCVTSRVHRGVFHGLTNEHGGAACRWEGWQRADRRAEGACPPAHRHYGRRGNFTSNPDISSTRR